MRYLRSTLSWIALQPYDRYMHDIFLFIAIFFLGLMLGQQCNNFCFLNYFLYINSLN